MVESYWDAMNRILKRGDFENKDDIVVLDFNDDIVYIIEYENGIKVGAGEVVACSVEALRKVGLFISETENGEDPNIFKEICKGVKS